MPKPKRYLDNGGKPDKKTVYKAKYTGKIYNTAREAAIDNTRYLREPVNRFDAKSKEYPRYKELNIPFIEEKRRTLSNAGLATGAVISENLLDSIAKYADIEGLPLKTALGLVTKESTLGNPTDDKSVYKLLGEDKALFFKRGGGGQFINKGGQDIDARGLVNYYKDTWNPYEEAIKIAKIKATGSNGVFVKPVNWGNDDNPNYLEALNEYNKQKAIFDKILIEGEKYADRQAEKKRSSIRGNVLQAAFRDYKTNPNGYNPGQRNYPQLVERRGNEVWNSPEIQNWYKRRNNKRNGGRISLRNGGRLQFRGGGKKPITTGGAGYPIIQISNVPETLRPLAREFNRKSVRTYNLIKNISALANDGANYFKKVSSSIVLPVNEKRKRLYKNINPNAGYVDPFNRMFRALTNTGSDDMWNREAVADDAFATYLQIPTKERKFNTRLPKSKYKPTIGSVVGDIYALPLKDTELDKGTIINDAKDIKINETAPATVLPISGHGVLGNYTLSRGFDNKGEYVSYYDEYNLNPFRGFFAKRDGNNAPNFVQNIEDLSFGLGKPFTLYDRIYLDDYYGVKNPTHATYLPEVTIYGRNKKASGGTIHIAPSKRGTFTAAATKHGMGVQEFANTVLRNKDRYSPSLVKKANFARNASKWNH